MKPPGWLRGPVLLTVWAFAPPLPVPTDTGTVTVSVGATAGQYELVSRSCEGDVVSDYGVPVRNAAMEVEYRPGDIPLRATAYGGGTTIERGVDGPGPGLTQGGPFLGGVVAYEGGRLGVGAGSVLLPGDEFEVMPSLYFRVGWEEGVHLRTDFLTPTPLPGASGLARLGVGFPFGDEHGGALLGLSAGRALDLSDEWNGGPFAEISYGITPSLEALVAGSWFSSEFHADWGLGAGIRWRP